MGKDDKPRGKISSYAFFVKTISEEHKLRHPEERIHFADFTKKCSEKWKSMNVKEKSRFEQMAREDKVRYDTEMSTYAPPKEVPGKKRKRRRVKDPNAPKKALSAFMFFSSANRPAIREKHADWGVADIAKELGKMWAMATPDDKKQFDERSTQDKERYSREKGVYEREGRLPPQVGLSPLQQQQQQIAAAAAAEHEDIEEDED